MRLISTISILVCLYYSIAVLNVTAFHAAGFKSKKIRVNLNLPIKAEVKAESTDVLKAVDEDRKYVIQATIVRYAHAKGLYSCR